MTLKIGIIGYGKMGQTRHQAIERTDTGTVIGIYGFPGDPVPADLSLPDIDSLLARDDIEAVYICAINSLNKELTIAALEAGKHVFCEKPPAFTAADVEEIRKVEAQSGKVLMYGFNHRHHGAAVKMKQVVDGGELGRILWMRGRYGKSVDEDYLETWRAKPELAEPTVQPPAQPTVP